MNGVLLVTYHYPPGAAVGGVRPSKFAAYLPLFDWTPIVVAARPSEGHQGGPTNEGRVHYVGEWPHPLKTYERWQERHAARAGEGASHAATRIVPYEQCYTVGRRSLKQWLLPFLSLPDRETGWLIPAVMRSVGLVRRHRLRHVITTGPPFTTHLAGLLIKRMTGVRWVADFRDPWSLRHKFPIFRNGGTDALEGRWIRAVMRRADVVLAVTAAMTDEARKEHADLPPDHFRTLQSGFDPVELASIRWTRPAPAPIVVSYFGTFYHGRTPEPLLQALKSLLDEGTVRRADLRVRFVGQVGHAEGRSVGALIHALGLAEIVSLHRPVPRAEALRQTLESHISLVLDERHPVQIPLKLYDALAAGVVVLNIGSHGAVADVLKRTGRGIPVHYQDLREIREGLLECLRRVRAPAGRWSAEPWRDPAIQEFDFRRLTGQLAGYLTGDVA